MAMLNNQMLNNQMLNNQMVSPIKYGSHEPNWMTTPKNVSGTSTHCFSPPRRICRFVGRHRFSLADLVDIIHDLSILLFGISCFLDP